MCWSAQLMLCRRAFAAGALASLIFTENASAQQLQKVLNLSAIAGKCLAYNLSCAETEVTENKYYDIQELIGGGVAVSGYIRRTYSEYSVKNFAKDIACYALLDSLKDKKLQRDLYSAPRLEYLLVLGQKLGDFYVKEMAATTQPVYETYTARGLNTFVAWDALVNDNKFVRYTDFGKCGF